MSTWLFDLGNTSLKCARLVDGVIADVVRIDHADGAFVDGWMRSLPSRFDTAWVASVAATGLTVAVIDALTSRCRRLSLVRTQRAFAGIRVAYGHPDHLGVDRFLAMVAAHARVPAAPWLVVGVGTALTIDLIDIQGLHRGGRIAPSPTLMRESLHARASHLPLHGGAYVVFANDTAPALASGCEGAALALVSQSAHAAADLLGTAPGVLLHGGGASALWPEITGATLAPTLVLDGIAIWAGAFAAGDVA
ncbi:MAG: type pantothenate kinase [Xanthomonadaceae bacterium]|nr:type pantothenate kinase [Xanthomonadaceae bacterium]